MQLKHVVCLRRPQANMHHRKLPVKIGLNASEVAISTLRTNVYMACEKFKRKENGCRMSWLRDRWKIEEPLPKFCFCGMKERVSCIELLLAMRSGFRESQTQKIVAFIWQSINIDGQIASEKSQCFAFGGGSQKGIVYYKLLKPSKTVNRHHNRQQLINLNNVLLEKRPEWDTRHERVILQYDNVPCHRTSIVQDTIKTLKWDLLPHLPYSPDLAPSDYHLFRSIAHGLAGLHLANFEQVQNWLDEWFRSKDTSFYRRGIHVLPERWQKCVASEGRYFE